MNHNKKGTIIDALRHSSINILVPFIDKYPLLKNILNESKSKKPSDEWDFFMTVAGIGLVVISKESYEGEHDELNEQLIELNDNNIKVALDDFLKYINRPLPKQELILPAVGLWVLMNVKKAQLTVEETKELAPVIGYFLADVINDWRNEKIK